MSLLIGLLAHQVSHQTKVQSCQFLYLDDRVVLTNSIGNLRTMLTSWDEVAHSFGLSNNEQKLQVWTSEDAHAT